MIPEILFVVTRIILGIILIIFPINALFIKAFAPKIPPKGAALMDAMRESGYLLQFVQWSELIVGILLLSNQYPLIALLVLLPISINIFLFHFFLAPPIFGPGILILMLNIFLLTPHYSELIKLIK